MSHSSAAVVLEVGAWYTKCGFAHKPDKRSHLKVGDRWAMHEFYLATPTSFDRS